MTSTAYLYALIQPQAGVVRRLEIHSDPSYSGPCGITDLVAAQLLQQDGPDFESARDNLLRSVSRIPNLRYLWEAFAARPWAWPPGATP